jgi:glycosyltransferase involved in cell wall biosynthesis
LQGERQAENKPLGVSFIATLLNEEETLAEWWSSIMGQTRRPDEVVVVDGGSRDGTVSVLTRLANDAPFGVRVEVLEGSNIAQGRNRAISMARNEVIAVSDGGCILEPHWLENLVRPMEEDPQVQLVAGFYQPLHGRWFQDLAACATLPLYWEVRERRFMPSSRSLAFRRGVWERVGGYPEWLDIGEDMYFNHTWKKMGIKHVMAKEALVYWRMREDLPSLLKQYFLYARGDGESGMYPQRHLLRFATYAWLAFILAGKGNRASKVATIVAAQLYAGRRWARIPSFMAMHPAWQRAAAVPAILPLMFLIDAAKMAGYVNGLTRRRR